MLSSLPPVVFSPSPCLCPSADASVSTLPPPSLSSVVPTSSEQTNTLSWLAVCRDSASITHTKDINNCRVILAYTWVCVLCSVTTCGYMSVRCHYVWWCHYVWLCHVLLLVATSCVITCGYVMCHYMWICQVSLCVTVSGFTTCCYAMCHYLWLCHY